MGRVRESLITGVCALLSFSFAPFRRPPAIPSDPAVLVLKPCCLGDLLLATVAIAALREAFPRSRIALATGAWSRSAVERNPHLNEIIDCGTVGRGGATRPGDYRRLVGEVRRRRFDLAIVLDRSPLVSLIPLLAGIPIRAGLDSRRRGFSLTHRAPVPRGRHEAELYLDVVRALGYAPGKAALHFTVSPEEHAWAEEALGNQGRWVAVHSGGGVNPGSVLLGKRWPAGRFAAIGERLLRQGYSVVLVGGSEDRPLAQEIAGSVSGSREGCSAKLLDLTGATSFARLGAVLQRCQLFLGNDTGPMHLAVAVGTPVVAIFGPSSPQVYGPFSSRAAVVYHGEHCGQCEFRGGLAVHCRNGFACTNAATAEEVWAVVQRLLAHEREESH